MFDKDVPDGCCRDFMAEFLEFTANAKISPGVILGQCKDKLFCFQEY